jgi:hypothetical protein
MTHQLLLEARWQRLGLLRGDATTSTRTLLKVSPYLSIHSKRNVAFLSPLLRPVAGLANSGNSTRRSRRQATVSIHRRKEGADKVSDNKQRFLLPVHHHTTTPPPLARQPHAGGIATLDAQQPPPPDMPARPAASVEDTAPAANVQAAPEAPLLSPQVRQNAAARPTSPLRPLFSRDSSFQEVSAMLSAALDRILANTDARRADDVRKRIKPLQSSLDKGAFSSSACAHLGALLQGRQRAITLHHNGSTREEMNFTDGHVTHD